MTNRFLLFMYTFAEKPDYRFAISYHGTLCGEEDFTSRTSRP